ncbi:uncharacterized protein APUU_61279S [Aspergillus puulaauensis]|uniref:tyrosinase n=1 Tax=Aspergillus puulaauensis TaxID=1220207 RepID=A0A7R7XUY8_9EURO|nr:uncharacterized protein APUU_61279S [Aspergillus puulaauensis]BCS28231.1 hypothetical protein APUU_61279S [Aspergillus puulaauensis]
MHEVGSPRQPSANAASHQSSMVRFAAVANPKIIVVAGNGMADRWLADVHGPDICRLAAGRTHAARSVMLASNGGHGFMHPRTVRDLAGMACLRNVVHCQLHRVQAPVRLLCDGLCIVRIQLCHLGRGLSPKNRLPTVQAYLIDLRLKALLAEYTVTNSSANTMVYKFYPITGIAGGKGPNGEVPLRQDIEVWSLQPENRMQVVLFLKALKRLQDVPPENRDSFFQIAGIHGMPFTSWDEPFETEENIGVKGYCTHANCLFPSWHRPYLLLYEAGSPFLAIMPAFPH